MILSALFFIKIVLAILESFLFPYEILNYLFHFNEKYHLHFDRNDTESIDCLG